MEKKPQALQEMLDVVESLWKQHAIGDDRMRQDLVARDFEYIFDYKPPRKWSVRLEWKPADSWIGAFWDRRIDGFHIWICLVPMIPIHIKIS